MKIPEQVQEKLRKIAKLKGKDYEEILQEYREVYEMVEKYYDLQNSKEVPTSALRHLLGRALTIDEMTEVLMPTPL